MTGDPNIDAVLLVVALVLGAVADRFGWPWLGNLAELLKRKKGEEKDPAGWPPVKEGEPLEAPALLGKKGSPLWVSVLLALMPFLMELLQRFKAEKGREPTREEVEEMIRQGE